MNMYNWMERVIYGPKKPFPLLSYPCVQYLYVTVKELVCSSAHQAIGMKMIADHYDMLASTAYKMCIRDRWWLSESPPSDPYLA